MNLPLTVTEKSHPVVTNKRRRADVIPKTCFLFCFWIKLNFLKQMKYLHMEIVTAHFRPHVHTRHIIMVHHEIMIVPESKELASGVGCFETSTHTQAGRQARTQARTQSLDTHMDARTKTLL